MERRKLIDRIRLSEFFALICTTFMLLALFLLSSVNDGHIHQNSHRPIAAGFPAQPILDTTPEKKEDETAAEIPAATIPMRSIDGE